MPINPNTNINHQPPPTLIHPTIHPPVLHRPVSGPRPRGKSRRLKTRRFNTLLLLPVLGCCMAVSACQDDTPKVAPVPVTDTRPVGDGLKVIGFAMLGAAVVAVLGRLLK
jgi:hypothetical protein